MFKYTFITVVLFSFASNLFSQEEKMIEHTVILPETYSPVILNEDKNPIIINDKTFMLTSPYMEKAFTMIESLPSLLKQQWPSSNFELYKINGNTLTENYFILNVEIYTHNTGAEITYKNNHIEIIADELTFSKYIFVYIMLENERYTVICFADSPHYNLLTGSHWDTVGIVPTMANRELAKDILYYYMREKEILNIKASSIQLSRKEKKRVEKRLKQ